MHSFGQLFISAWYGAIVDIPYGWVLCDGTNGTPDLRDRFLVGAGDTYNKDDSGGSVNHQHDFTGNGHLHDLDSGADLKSQFAILNKTSTDPAVGTTDNATGIPPFKGLCYIMKI